MTRFLLLIFFTIIHVSFLSAQSTATAIGQSLSRFVDSLSPAQKAQTVFSFADTSRTQWTNLPVGARPRKGVSISQLSNTQRELFHRVLSASLSSQGYLKVTSVMHMDNITNALLDSMHRRGRMNDTVYKSFTDFQYGSGNYYIAVFGSPLKDSAWGLKVEGHHLSLNITYKNGRLFYTPFFIGILPSSIPLTEYAGWRVLGREQDLSLRLFVSLTSQQRKKAVRNDDVPNDVFTHSESGKNTLPNWGLKSNELTTAQRTLVEQILEEYINNLPMTEQAMARRSTKVDTKGHVYFGWIGSDTESEPHYFILNGPGFLLEFDDVGNHVHSIWREKRQEFGTSVLKE